MSDSTSKVFMFPDNNGNNSLDPNLMMALQNGGFGGNGNWMWIIFLFFLYPLMRNGGFFGNGGDCQSAHNGTGFGPLANMINNSDGRQLLDAAINRNGAAIDKLSGMFGCGKDTILSAINSLNQSIACVGNQTNSNIADVKYAMSLGNQNITSQLANCCCDIKESITAGNYQNQLQTVQQTNTITGRIDQLANGITQGFSATAYETAQQTCALQNTIKDSNAAVIAKLDAIEDSRKDREINALTAALAAKNAQAERQAELAPILKQLGEMQCKLPATVTLPYSCATAVPTSAVYGAYGYGLNNGLWS